MDRDGGLAEDVDHVVHVPGAKRPDAARRDSPMPDPVADGGDGPLAHPPPRDRERARRVALIMEAGRLFWQPGPKPHLKVAGLPPQHVPEPRGCAALRA